MSLLPFSRILYSWSQLCKNFLQLVTRVMNSEITDFLSRSPIDATLVFKTIIFTENSSTLILYNDIVAFFNNQETRLCKTENFCTLRLDFYVPMDDFLGSDVINTLGSPWHQYHKTVGLNPKVFDIMVPHRKSLDVHKLSA